MNRIHHVEVEEHDWGSLAVRYTPVTLQAAQALIRSYPLEQQRAVLARLGRRGEPSLQFRKNGNDYCFVTFHADGTFGFHVFYVAANYTRYNIPLQEACDLVDEYFSRPHFGWFRELARRGDGMLLLGSTLKAKALRIALRI